MSVKMTLGGLAFGLCSVCSAAMLELSNSTTWTDLTALEGYDGVTIAAGRTLTLNPASGTTMNFTQVIAGDGGIVKDGAGNLELRGANTFNGTCVIGGTGNVYAYSNTAFGSATGRTTLYEHLFTNGAENTGELGANLYLCGITTSEGFDLICNDKKKYLYAQQNTDNTINGSVTIRGNQVSAYALNGGTLRFRGGISPATGSSTFRPSTDANGRLIVENLPMTCGMWNAITGNGTFLLSAPGNSCSYTWHPITLGCAWAFNGASVAWDTGGSNMKVDLNGYPNRVQNISCTKETMNGWVTSTRGKAFLYYKGTSDVSTYLPFRGAVGLFHEGNVTTTLMKNSKSASDTTGELCVTNGTVAFDAAAGWTNVTAVTLAEKGKLTLTAAGQIGTKAVLDLLGDSLLTLPANCSVTVRALKLDGVWQAAGTYAAAQLNGHLQDNGATVTVTYTPRANWINVFSDATWDDAALAALDAAEGVYIYPGVTLTTFNTTAYAFNKPVAGAGTLVLDGTGRLDLNVANPEFTGALDIRGYTDTASVMRPVYVNNGDFFGTADGATTVHMSKDDASNSKGANPYGIDIYFNASFATDEPFTFKSYDSPGRIRGVTGKTVTFNGDVVSTGSQVSYKPEAWASFVFNTSFSGGNVSLSPEPEGSIVFNCPCTAGIFNSHGVTASSRVFFNTTGNTPLGYFCCTVVFGTDWAWNNVDGVLGMAYYDNVKLDLNGHPQRVTSISYYGSTRPLSNCSYATDSTGAKTFLYVNSTATADSRVYFKGTAGLYWENTGTVTFKETTSTSRGDLTVAKGRVIFDTATWLTGDTVTVKDGAVLELKDVTKFGFRHIVVEEGGKIVMPTTGGTLVACDLTLGATTYPAGSSVSLADHTAYFEGTGTISCTGDYVINVAGANACVTQEVTIAVPAGTLRIVKTGAGTALVKAGTNAAPGAEIVVRAGVLGVATQADASVLFNAVTPFVVVEDGGTLDVACMTSGYCNNLFRKITFYLAGAGATDGDGSKMGAIRMVNRTGSTDLGGGFNNMFGSLVFLADTSLYCQGRDCGCTGGGTPRILNGHTITKLGNNQWYWGNESTAGNFIVKAGNFIFFADPRLAGTAENFVRVEGGGLMFNNCTAAMTPIPHTLDWQHGSGNLAVYSQFGAWAGPWEVTKNLTLDTSAKWPNGGRLTMQGAISSVDKTFTLNTHDPTLVLTGPNHHTLGPLNVNGALEVRDGAIVEMMAASNDGFKTEVGIAQSIARVDDYGTPARVTVSNATIMAAQAATAANNVYGNFVLSWSKDYAAELNVQAGASLTGCLMCAQGGLGVVKQSGGEFVSADVSGKDNATTVGNDGTSYGAYLLTGGRFDVKTRLTAAISRGATSIVRQDGGEFISGTANRESFDTRAGYFSFYQTGGVFTNASAISFGWNATANGGRHEIGLTGAGTYHYNYWDIRIGAQNAFVDTNVLYLADGAVLDTRCINYANVAGAEARRFFFGSAGGVIKPHNEGKIFCGRAPDRATLYAGGLVVDTSNTDKDSEISVALLRPTGKVVTGITLPTDAAYLAETNFLGPARITIDGGAGFGATAVTTYREQGRKRALTGVEIVSPGFGYAAGDGVTATVEGQFKKTSYPCTVTLGDPDTTGGLTKRGANRLVMTGENDYDGVTRIEGGTLEFTAGSYPTNSNVEISAEAANAARSSGTPALVVANFPNGRTVTVTGAEKLSLDDLRRSIRLVRFTGTQPSAVQLRLLDSNGNPYVLPDGNQLYYRNGVIALGVPLGFVVIIH